MPPSSDEFAPTDRVKQDMALIGLEPLVQIGRGIWPRLQPAARALLTLVAGACNQRYLRLSQSRLPR